MVASREIKVLDKGYVRLVEAWGSDQAIVEAARMSTGKGFLGWGTDACKRCGRSQEELIDMGMRGDDCADGGRHEIDIGDRKLLDFLYRNRHDTPFEMAGMIIEVQAPIFLFREWHRHRVPWSYNEASARYAPLPALDYIPDVPRLMLNVSKKCACGAVASWNVDEEGTVCGKNPLPGGEYGPHKWTTKQAGAAEGASVLTDVSANAWLESLGNLYEHAQAVYQNGLDLGVPKELARLAMTVGRNSKMRASANLRGWFHLFGLRMASGAQWEFREYGQACWSIAKELFPRACHLFENVKQNTPDIYFRT